MSFAPSPIHHHSYGWYVPTINLMGGLWHCFTHTTKHAEAPTIRLLSLLLCGKAPSHPPEHQGKGPAAHHLTMSRVGLAS